MGIDLNIGIGIGIPGARSRVVLNPLQLFGSTDLKFWHRADAGVTGDPVSDWADQSGNGRTVSQGTAASRPDLVPAGQNGLPVLRFDGVDDRLRSTAAGLVALDNSTVFAVFKISDEAQSGALLTIGSSESTPSTGLWFLFEQAGPDKMTYHQTDAGAAPLAATDLTTQWYVYVATRDGAFNTAYYKTGNVADGTGVSAAFIAGQTGLTYGDWGGIASAALFDGDLAEIGYIGKVISASERQQLFDWLARWGVT